MTTIGGFVDDGWGLVRDAFESNLASNEEVGASVAVRHRGRVVVNLWGGWFDEGGTRPYDDSTLQLVFSTTKGITALAVAMCVQRGLLSYDDPVAAHWPEFAAHGKGDATVAQLLSHQCGLIAPDGPLSTAQALDWDTITARLADTRPDWPIGSGHGYHALTFGWLAGEVLRRVDPQHRTPGAFVATEIAAPLGLDMWIGLPEHLEARVSPIIGGALLSASADPALKALIDAFLGPQSRAGRALMLNGAFSLDDSFNRRHIHAAEIPAANGITTAASLATMYAATLAPVDGVRLLDDATREAAAATITPDGERDLCLMAPSTFGMGFMTHGLFTPFAGEGSFGHTGAGGSVGFAQPQRELAFGYTMNKMATNLGGDVRAQRLIDAAAAAADRAG